MSKKAHFCLVGNNIPRKIFEAERTSKEQPVHLREPVSGRPKVRTDHARHEMKS